MNRIRRIVKEHQLISFFALSYLTTCLLLLPYFLTGIGGIIGILVLVGIFGPAFANIIISRIVAPISNENPRSRKHITFLVTWVIATVIYTLYVHTTSGIESPFALVFFAIVGLLPAFVLASAFSKFPVVRRSLSSIINPRGHMGWYLFALLIFPVIKLISILITKQLGLRVIYEPDRGYDISRLLGLVAVPFLYGLVFTGGLNEEVGWTGFALPRLQASYSPFIASIILWFFWFLWHMPMQIAGYWIPDWELSRVLIEMFFARFIFTWLYNKTRGGILSAVLFHASANASSQFLLDTRVSKILQVVLAVLIISMARMWEKLPDHSPGVYRTTEETA